MKTLYDRLLLTDDYIVTSVKQYISNLSTNILSLFPGENSIRMETQVDDFQLESRQLFPLGIILNELLTNVMKYSFAPGDSGLIQISMKKINREVVLVIQDNGKGIPEGFDFKKSKGFGLLLVEMLCEQLDGSFTMENKNGTRSTLVFEI